MLKNEALKKNKAQSSKKIINKNIAKKVANKKVATKPKQTEINKDPNQPVDQKILIEIRRILQTKDFAQVLIDALGPNGSTVKITKLLETHKAFRKYPTFGNPPVAKRYASDIAGIGVIESLLESHKNGEPITDIGFNSNGFLTIETNKDKYTYGNKPNQPKITRDYIESLILRFAQKDGVEGTSFTKNNPLFNGSDEKEYLRISANHQAVAPYGITMSIRVSQPKLALDKHNFHSFAPANEKSAVNVYELFRLLIQSHANVLISAETGAGKTELQKMLIGFAPEHDRIVTIEDVTDTHLPKLYPNKDIYSWLTNNNVSITDLIKQGLRNNPKWLIIAETRGQEAYEMFQGVLSGHSIITTLHAISNQAVPTRFVGMAKMGFNIDEGNTRSDFLRYMDIGVHIRKAEINGKVIRYCDELAEFVPECEKYPTGINVLLRQHIRRDGVREYWTGEPSEFLKEKVYIETDKQIDNWTVISKDKPVKELLYPDLYKRAHPEQAQKVDEMIKAKGSDTNA